MASAKNPPKMDDLLQKLRRSIAELSLQGDDFTRQMWHMYSTFEDVVGPEPHARPRPSSAEDAPREAPVKPPRAPSYPDVHRSSSSPQRRPQSPAHQSPGARRKRMSAPPRSQDYPRGSPGSPRHCRSRTEPSSNPLLDTIGSMTYDPCCESDDYYDLSSVYQQRRRPSRGTESSAHQHSDGESIGYAGSNSVDSGYKSLCPTPEIPDYTTSDPKPKIMMGTRVMSRQGTTGTTRTKDLDADLDHLMHLRQSLLSAIAHCEARPGSPKARNAVKQTSRPTAAPSDDERRQESSQKTVRFNTDAGKVCKAKAGRTKPILKDPLCANLRAHMERPDPDAGNLEEEIDSLLCGRSDQYDQETVEGFPCSYVTMIEDKYRCSGNFSVAKVKCLKDKCHETSKDHNHATLKQDLPPSMTSSNTRSKVSRPPEPHHPPATDPSATTPYSAAPPAEPASNTPRSSSSVDAVRSTFSSAKSRFSEVAKCMLEIIEDLQHKKTDPRASNKQSKQPVKLRDTPRHAVPPKRPASVASDSEYHVYEEVLYDLVGGTYAPERPPPLPARPRDQGVEPGNWPKQRSNLYSLVRNPEERRNISRSLEQESRHGGGEDEYGFKALASS
ncbi:uncharacterized protein LOC135388067 isoform X2 [Ornithodoros turicata]|uniref:uncharacterized protein LOC135388067 isoform X2 n=1 Tax=Ornithodoros turicata TaxID=34597 RepID=UPI003139B815